MAQCRIELLGGLRVQREGHLITRFRTQKAALLLAYLAFYHERSHSREELAELLWPEDEFDTARERLRSALSSLRRQLEPPGVPAGSILIANRAALQLNTETITTDVAEFEAVLLAASQGGSDLAHAQHLTDAVELYRGELLPCYQEEWILTERQRLAEASFQALRQLTRHFEQSGDLPRALEYARRAVAADPLWEEAHHDLMRLLAAAGQPEAALRQFMDLERILEQELGEVPEEGSRRLAREIKQQPRRSPAPSPERAPSPAFLNRDGSSPTPHPPDSPPLAPVGTFTFLLTELAGASSPRKRGGEAAQAASFSEHDWLHALFCRHRGQELRRTGDSLLAVFPRAGDALSAAVAAQRALASVAALAGSDALEVRMALHTADVDLGEELSQSPVHHRLTRLVVAAHPGQILLSEATGSILQENLEPGLHLTDLGAYRLRAGAPPERLFQVQVPGTALSRPPAPTAAPAHEGYLPLPPTRFFGREQEIRRLQELLTGKTRLLTLIGPGGSGKTRLAMEVARRLRTSFHGAVWFVPLADVLDARRIAGKVREALRLPPSPDQDPLEQVVAFLSRQRSLLVLDNFEHLATGGAPIVRTLLKRVPTLTCVVTSRQRLGLPGGREFTVLPLPIPRPDDSPEQLIRCESVQLFLDRAQAARPDFQVTAANAAALAALCQRLEGIPLALELAAARALTMPPAQMLARLEQRFDLLVSRQRGVGARHRSLWAALDWSYQLLSPELQRLFARLSVFRGGFTPGAAEVVCAEPRAREYLPQLVEATLVLAEENDPETRYHLLETLREFGVEQLSREDRAALSQRHAEYFLALAEQAGPHLLELEWMERLKAEQDNLRAALAWSQSAGDLEQSLRLAALWQFWEFSGSIAEGRRWLNELLARSSELSLAARARALDAAARLAYVAGDYAQATRFGEESLRLLRELEEPAALARGLNSLGQLAVSKGEYERAGVLLEEAESLCRALGDNQTLGTVLDVLGNLALRYGDYRRAVVLKEESLAAFRQAGLALNIAGALGELGYLLSCLGEYERAHGMIEEQLAIYEHFEDGPAIPRARWLLGRLLAEQGHYERAGELLEESVAAFRQLERKSCLADALASLGTLAGYQGKYNQAFALHEEALSLRRELGDRWDIANSMDRLGWVALHQGDSNGARRWLEESLALFRQVEDKRGIASSLHNLGHLALTEGDLEAARFQFEEALTLRQQVGEKRGIAECLEGLAAVVVNRGRPEPAARLLGAAEALREAIGTPLPPVSRSGYERSVAAIRAAAGEVASAAAWEEGRRLPLEQAIAAASSTTPDASSLAT